MILRTTLTFLGLFGCISSSSSSSQDDYNNIGQFQVSLEHRKKLSLVTLDLYNAKKLFNVPPGWVSCQSQGHEYSMSVTGPYKKLHFEGNLDLWLLLYRQHDTYWERVDTVGVRSAYSVPLREGDLILAIKKDIPYALYKEVSNIMDKKYKADLFFAIFKVEEMLRDHDSFYWTVLVREQGAPMAFFSDVYTYRSATRTPNLIRFTGLLGTDATARIINTSLYLRKHRGMEMLVLREWKIMYCNGLIKFGPDYNFHFKLFDTLLTDFHSCPVMTRVDLMDGDVIIVLEPQGSSIDMTQVVSQLDPGDTTDLNLHNHLQSILRSFSEIEVKVCIGVVSKSDQWGVRIPDRVQFKGSLEDTRSLLKSMSAAVFIYFIIICLCRWIAGFIMQ